MTAAKRQPSEFETDLRSPMTARLFRIPFSPQLLIVALAGWVLFRGGVELLGIVLYDEYLYAQFQSALFTRALPVGISLFDVQPGVGAEIHPLMVAAILGWGVLVWAVFGIAICRMVAVSLATAEPLPLRRGLAFAWSTKWSNLAYPMIAASSLALLYATCGAIGALAGIPGIGPVLLIVAMPVLAILALCFTIIAIGYTAGAGVASAALATERNGSLDAVSRVFDYTFREPVYVLFATTLMLVFARFLFWAGHQVLLPSIEGSLLLLWNSDTLREILDAALHNPAFPRDGLDLPQRLATTAVSFGFATIEALIAAAVAAFLLSASTFIYFNLRRDVDGIPFDQLDAGTRNGDELTGIPTPRS